MELFWIWLVGFLVTTITLGVLYHKEIIDWAPNGDNRKRYSGSGDMPHIIAGALWWIMIPLGAVVFALIGLYKGINWLSAYLARISIERKE